MSQLTQSALAQLIDHTCLKPEARLSEIQKLCEEAARFQFASVCVLPSRVFAAANFLKGSGVRVGTVIGFPLGGNSTAVKAMEVIRALADHAEELDVVIQLGALKDIPERGELAQAEVLADLQAVVKAAQGRVVKAILETCLLTDAEIVLACQIAEKAGVQFVKTSTGFSSGGASIEAVRLMKQTVGERCQVKASGGIRDLQTLKRMIDAGATRIGTSAGVHLIESLSDQSEHQI